MRYDPTTRPTLRRLALPLAALAAVFALAFAGQQATADTDQASGNRSGVPAVDNKEQPTAPPDSTPQSRESVRDDGDGSTTEVMVNGERLTVPENGSYQRTTEDSNGRTDVKVDNRNQSTSSGDGSSNSSSSEVRIDVRSESSSSSGDG